MLSLISERIPPFTAGEDVTGLSLIMLYFDGPELVVGDDVGREALIGAGPQDRGEFVDA